MTKYRILLEKTASDHPPLYAPFSDEVEAHGPQQAIRKAVLAAGEDAEVGTYIAVPVANWTEEPVRFDRPPPRLVIGGAAPAQTSLDDAPPAEEPEA